MLPVGELLADRANLSGKHKEAIRQYRMVARVGADESMQELM